MKVKAAVVMPFADFWRPLRWNDYPALQVIDNHLKYNGIDSRIIDINEEFYNRILKNIRIEDYKGNGPREASLVHFLKKDPEKIFSNEEFYEEVMKPFSYFEDEYGEDSISTMKDAEMKIKSVEGQRLQKVTESIIKDKKFRRDIFLITIPTKIHIVSAMMLGRLLKRHHPGCHVTFGGPVITLSGKKESDWLVERGYCDTYAIEPGRNNVAEIIKNVGNGIKGEVISSDEVNINDEINVSPRESETVRIVISRGCYWRRCKFCDFRCLNNTFRIKKISVLMKEIENLIEVHKKRDFFLITDSLPPEYAKALSESIIEKGWVIRWTPRFMKIDKGFNGEFFRLMKESGGDLSGMHLGIDGMTDGALELADKGYTISDAIGFLEEVRNSGMVIKQINLIYDLPGTDYRGAMEFLDTLEEFADVFINIGAFPFQLTSSSEMGKNPEKYGLKIVNKDAGKRKMPFCNNLDFIDRNGFTNDERKIINKRLHHLQMSLKAGRKYKELDKRGYNSIKSYTPSKVKMEVKIPSQLEKISAKGKEICIHSDMLINDIIMETQYFFSKVKLGKWYSVEHLASFREEDNPIRRFVILQQTFRQVRELIALGYFSDVRLKKMG